MVDVNRGRRFTTGPLPLNERGLRPVRFFIIDRHENVVRDPQGRGMIWLSRDDAARWGERHIRGSFAVCGMAKETWEEFKVNEKPDTYVVVDVKGWKVEDQL